MHLYLSRILPATTSLGPGRRIGLWVQGCSLGCKGCMSPELTSRQKQSRTSVKEALQEILSFAPEHTGITVSGGEPFEQPEALAILLKMIRRRSVLDILVYSGYTMEQIRSGNPAMQDLLEQADVLIDGPYRLDLPTQKLWRGSANQGMHILSRRARYYQEFMEKEYSAERPLQVVMDKECGLHIIGIPEPGLLDHLESRMQKRGIILDKAHTEATDAGKSKDMPLVLSAT